MSDSHEIYSDTFVECVPKNVVLIGDSRVGKTTFVSLLQKQIETTAVEEPYQGTIDPVLNTLYFHNASQCQHICINILDTPGLNEISANGTPRPNEELKDVISDHIKKGFCSIDLVLIVLQKKGITENVISSLYEIKEWFGNRYLDNLCLLITHCDNFEAKDEQEYLTQLKKNASVNDFCRAINNRILFSGRNNPKGLTTDELDFAQQQNRRKEHFLELVLASKNKKLSEGVLLSDIRPIDVLESAAVTNKDILALGEANLVDKNAILTLLDALHKLDLEKEDKEQVHRLVNTVGEVMKKKELAKADEKEKDSAKKYNDAEVPLKKKAKELQADSIWLKTQLKVLIDTLNRFKLFELEAEKSVEEVKATQVITVPRRKR